MAPCCLTQGSRSTRLAATATALAVLAAGAGCATARGVRTDLAQPVPAALPDIELPDLDGRQRTIEEFSGRVVLLDLWATWCEPCLESLPVYADLQAELGDAGLQVIAVSVDAAGTDVEGFAARYAPGVLVLLDPQGSVPAQLGLKVMPTAILLGRDGKVAAVREGFHKAEVPALREEIVGLLGTTAPVAGGDGHGEAPDAGGDVAP